MNNTKPVIWNINASLFQCEQQNRELRHLVATLRRQLVAERKAYYELNQVIQQFTTELGNYAETLSGADTTPRKNGIQ